MLLKSHLTIYVVLPHGADEDWKRLYEDHFLGQWKPVVDEVDIRQVEDTASSGHRASSDFHYYDNSPTSPGNPQFPEHHFPGHFQGHSPGNPQLQNFPGQAYSQLGHTGLPQQYVLYPVDTRYPMVLVYPPTAVGFPALPSNQPSSQRPLGAGWSSADRRHSFPPGHSFPSAGESSSHRGAPDQRIGSNRERSDSTHQGRGAPYGTGWFAPAAVRNPNVRARVAHPREGAPVFRRRVHDHEERVTDHQERVIDHGGGGQNADRIDRNVPVRNPNNPGRVAHPRGGATDPRGGATDPRGGATDPRGGATDFRRSVPDLLGVHAHQEIVTDHGGRDGSGWYDTAAVRNPDVRGREVAHPRGATDHRGGAIDFRGRVPDNEERVPDHQERATDQEERGQNPRINQRYQGGYRRRYRRSPAATGSAESVGDTVGQSMGPSFSAESVGSTESGGRRESVERKEEIRCEMDKRHCPNGSLYCMLCIDKAVESLTRIPGRVPLIKTKFHGFEFDLSFVTFPREALKKAKVSKEAKGKGEEKEGKEEGNQGEVKDAGEEEEVSRGVGAEGVRKECVFDEYDDESIDEEVESGGEPLQTVRSVDRVICGFVEASDFNIFQFNEKGSRKGMLLTLSSYRANLRIMELLRLHSKRSFSLAMLTLKLWAKRHFVAGGQFGLFNGTTLTVLFVHVFLQNPEAPVSKLLSLFFSTFSQWIWPTPVDLEPSAATAMGNHNDIWPLLDWSANKKSRTGDGS